MIHYMAVVFREMMGLFRLLRNIEDDFITSNSAVAFRQTTNFLYQDRHGNWTVGKRQGPWRNGKALE